MEGYEACQKALHIQVISRTTICRTSISLNDPVDYGEGEPVLPTKQLKKE